MPDNDLVAEWLHNVGVPFPFFIRHVDFSGAAGGPHLSLDDRAKSILAEILDPDPSGEISVYLVASSDELFKVALTLCLFRGMGVIYVYVITGDDLQTLPAPILSPANCNIPCFWTRSRHHDLRLDRSQREQLARTLAADTNRKVSPKLKKKNRLDKCHQQAIADKCYSTIRPPTACANCDSSGQHVL